RPTLLNRTRPHRTMISSAHITWPRKPACFPTHWSRNKRGFAQLPLPCRVYLGQHVACECLIRTIHRGSLLQGSNGIGFAVLLRVGITQPEKRSLLGLGIFLQPSHRGFELRSGSRQL